MSGSASSPAAGAWDREEIRRRVRARLLAELAARPQTPSASSAPVVSPGEIITERQLRDLLHRGLPLEFPPGTRFTPLAREVMGRHGASDGLRGAESALRSEEFHALECVAIGGDHRGYALKTELAGALRSEGYDVLDCGTDSESACDYPVFARRVARAVQGGRATAGVVIDGAGIGSAIAANKVAGVRAAACTSEALARNAREHNHANVISLGSGGLTTPEALSLVKTFLATPFGSGRHAARVALLEGHEESEGAPRAPGVRS